MTVCALELRGLRKAYGGLVVTEDVSLTLPKGARHALIGPNGAGKSTLVGLISGVVRPDAGSVMLEGEDVSGKAPARRTKKGLVRTFQVTNLFPKLTVLENVLLAVHEHSGASRKLWRPTKFYTRQLDTARRIIASLGLSGDINGRVAEMSYGRQRLIEIAIAMALEPKVLLLDEPAAGIPGAEVHLLIEAINRLPAEIAILMIEHDMEIVRGFADNVTVLVQGRVLLTDTTAHVLESEDVRSVYLGRRGGKRERAVHA
jgi:branched-chain amino acid transport system ATP-binding protein